jgi:hypothetical protein
MAEVVVRNKAVTGNIAHYDSQTGSISRRHIPVRLVVAAWIYVEVPILLTK